ncbi:hypothetical protein [Streptomyces sp. NPDC012825]|uniref:hypothetical protein n=1 Tax=Streptomyces sp. NPDC012825 TaxID=3364851 RepID=UPI003686C3FF
MERSTGGGATAPSQAYAAALREAMAGYLAAGGTQKAITEGLPFGPSALSRYLSADRLLHPGDLPRLRAALAERGHPLDEQAYARLEGLCKAAYAASGSPSAQLTWLQYEYGRLTEEHKRSQQLAETRLTELEDRTGRLTDQLRQALGRIEKQDKNLRHAQDYTRQMETELAEQHKQADRLRGEVEVLRKQNRRLIEEQAGTVPGVSTPVRTAGPGRIVRHTEGYRWAGSFQGLDQESGFFTDTGVEFGTPNTPFTTSTSTSGPVTCGPPPHPPTIHRPNDGIEDFPPPPPPEEQAEARPPWLGYCCVALTTYLGWVLWLTFMAALVADPGPGIAVMIVTALVALACRVFVLGLLTKLLGLDDELDDRLRNTLFVTLAVTFAGWLASVMGLVFTVLGVDALATWIATEVLL